MNAIRNDLCSGCGRWHDQTGRPVLAMIDWRGKRWPVLPGTMPRHNGDDSGGREYGACAMGAPLDDSYRAIAATMADTLRAVLAVVSQPEPYPWREGALKQQIREDIAAFEALIRGGAA